MTGYQPSMSQSQAAVLPLETQENEGVIIMLSSALPWAISTVLHIGLFLVLFFAVATLVGKGGIRPDLDVIIPTTAFTGKQPGVISSNPEKPTVPTDTPPRQDQFPTDNTDGRSVYAGLNPNGEGRGNLEGESRGFGPGKGKSRILGIGGGGGSGGGGPLAPFGTRNIGGGPIKFFEEGSNARNVCYVIDRSGSMLETFDFVKAEMIRSINALGPNHNFHAIFFASGTPIENPPKKLVPATAANKQQVADFLRDVVPQGTTNPMKAMERAFQVTNDKGEKVQLIYMLTDGEFPPEAVAFIRKLNPDKKVKINTISFISDSGRPQLEAIAKESGGKFKFVTQDELGR